MHKTLRWSCVVALLTTTSCFFDLNREADIAPGEVGGRAVRDNAGDRLAASFARVDVAGTGRAKRADADGRFVVGPLADGAWVVRITADGDGDGWPERVAVRKVRISSELHASGLFFSEVEPRPLSVLLGDVVLDSAFSLAGNIDIAGDVATLNAAEPLALHAVAYREECVDDTPGANAGDGTCAAGEAVQDGALSRAAARGDERAFLLDGLIPERVLVVAFAYETAADGSLGDVVAVSEVREVTRTDPTIAPLVLDTLLQGATVSLLVKLSRQAETAEARVVLEGAPLPLCDDDLNDPIWSHVTRVPLTTSADAFSGEFPFGPADLRICTTSPDGNAVGELYAQLLLPGVSLPRVLLTDTDVDKCLGEVCQDGQCSLERDCDGDGLRGLPPIPDESDPAYDQTRALWVACASLCAPGGLDPSGTPAIGDNLITTCPVNAGGRVIDFDCDDDWDGQPDATEGQPCYGPGKGGDLDADDVCDPRDPYPRCTANTEEACTPDVDDVTPRDQYTLDPEPTPEPTPEPAPEPAPEPVDAGFDAGRDAGFDAGFDAGHDAGFDAGFDAGPGPCVGVQDPVEECDGQGSGLCAEVGMVCKDFSSCIQTPQACPLGTICGPSGTCEHTCNEGNMTCPDGFFCALGKFGGSCIPTIGCNADAGPADGGRCPDGLFCDNNFCRERFLTCDCTWQDLPGLAITFGDFDLEEGSCDAATFTTRFDQCLTSRPPACLPGECGFQSTCGPLSVCESDIDGDDIPDRLDNCPFDEDPDQTDTDGDGDGNPCDLDDDGDGLFDFADLCPLDPDPTNADGDSDGVGDVCDNCLGLSDPDQTDTDGDGAGDLCDFAFGPDLVEARAAHGVVEISSREVILVAGGMTGATGVLLDSLETYDPNAVLPDGGPAPETFVQETEVLDAPRQDPAIFFQDSGSQAPRLVIAGGLSSIDLGFEAGSTNGTTEVNTWDDQLTPGNGGALTGARGGFGYANGGGFFEQDLVIAGGYSDGAFTGFADVDLGGAGTFSADGVAHTPRALADVHAIPNPKGGPATFLVVGGGAGSPITPTSLVESRQFTSWSPLPNLPTAVALAKTQSLGVFLPTPSSSIFVIGGAISLAPLVLNVGIFVLEDGAPNWSITIDLATPRIRHTLAKHNNNCIVVIGGEDELGIPIDTTEVIEGPSGGPYTIRPGPTLAQARTRHASVVVNGTLYVIGGLDPAGNAIATTERVNLADVCR